MEFKLCDMTIPHTPYPPLRACTRTNRIFSVPLVMVCALCNSGNVSQNVWRFLSVNRRNFLKFLRIMFRGVKN